MACETLQLPWIWSFWRLHKRRVQVLQGCSLRLPCLQWALGYISCAALQRPLNCQVDFLARELFVAHTVSNVSANRDTYMVLTLAWARMPQPSSPTEKKVTSPHPLTALFHQQPTSPEKPKPPCSPPFSTFVLLFKMALFCLSIPF